MVPGSGYWPTEIPGKSWLLGRLKMLGPVPLKNGLG